MFCLKPTFWNLTQLSNVFLSEFRDTLQGIWIIVVRYNLYLYYAIILYAALSFRFKNPCQEYVHREDYTGKIVMDPYYPCIKYKDPADPKLDGTDYFIIAESMRLNEFDYYLAYDQFDCSLSLTCEKDQKAFYKLMKECLRFRIQGESFF